MPITLETYTGKILAPAEFPQDARTESAKFVPSQNIPLGTLLAKNSSTNRLAAYVHGDGTYGTPVAIAMFDMTTDANGVVYPANMSSAMPLWHAGPFQMLPVFVAGTFDTNDIPNWDAVYTVADWGGGAGVNLRGYFKVPN